MNINEATSTDLKVINALQKLGWRAEDTLLYRVKFRLSAELQQEFQGKETIEPDIVLQDLQHNILAVFENKLEDEKKALTKLRTLYYRVLKPRFLYACSPERVLFYDTAWKGLDAGEFRRVDGFMSLEEMLLKIEQEKKTNLQREIVIDKSIVGGFDPAANKERCFQTECVKLLIDKYKAGKQKMLAHLATGLGKTRIAVALSKALLEHGLAKRILFVVDRILLAKQALDENFVLISKDFPSAWIRSTNYKQYRNYNIHIVVIDTLENIYQNIPNTFYDFLIVDECHRSININRKLIFDHFLCPRLGLTATPKKAILDKGANISEADLEILDTYKLFGCESGEPDYQFDLAHGINEGFLAPYKVLEIITPLIKEAEAKGIEFSYVLDPDERIKIELDGTKKIFLEQLDRKYLSEEHAMRIAEEIKKNTEYGEKVLLFGVSQAHCLMLANAINKVFGDNDEVSPRYAEAIISDNSDLNIILKSWFKKPNRKPYIAVSVDIMTTGVDIPCIRYISFAILTKSVGKYTQMIGRGTRLDPKSGKFSFTILDFDGLCSKMADNGRGTPIENIKVIKGSGGKGGGGGNGPDGVKWYIIDNPDPAHLIQRVWIHGDTVQVIDNIPIESAKNLFEEEVRKSQINEISDIKNKAEINPNYEPSDFELRKLKEWINNPEIYLDEEQLKKIYEYPQGDVWEFYLHALGIRKIPSLKERIKKGFDSYINEYNFNDDQIKILTRMKDILASNMLEKKTLKIDDIFSYPVYEQLVGKRNDIEKIFHGNFAQILMELEESINV